MTILSIAISSAPVHAISQSTMASSGNPSANGFRSDGVLADANTKIAKFEKTLKCGLLKGTNECAYVLLQATTSEAKATVRIAGRTVFSKISRITFTHSFSPYIVDLFPTLQYEVFNNGIVGVKISGNAVAGAQFGATLVVGNAPGINAAAQSWGNAESKIQGEIFLGVARVEVSSVVNFFNTTLSVDLKAWQQAISLSRASVNVVLWQLYIKFKTTALWGLTTLWSKTLASFSGPSWTKTLL